MEANDFSSQKGFGAINLEAIAQVRGERFNTNFSYSGFNGKNIVLTGRQKITSVTVQGVSRQSIRLECIFFTFISKSSFSFLMPLLEIYS